LVLHVSIVGCLWVNIPVTMPFSFRYNFRLIICGRCGLEPSAGPGEDVQRQQNGKASRTLKSVDKSFTRRTQSLEVTPTATTTKKGSRDKGYVVQELFIKKIVNGLW